MPILGMIRDAGTITGSVSWYRSWTIVLRRALGNQDDSDRATTR